MARPHIPVSPDATYYYNRDGAVTYAQTYAMNPNTAEYNYYPDGDCANFVSQCLHAGGAPFDYSGAYWYPYIGSWQVVYQLRTYLLTNEAFGGVTSKESSMEPGDVLIFDTQSGAQIYDHAVIVSKVDSKGNIYYCAHTTDRLDYPLDNARPSLNGIYCIKIRGSWYEPDGR